MRFVPRVLVDLDDGDIACSMHMLMFVPTLLFADTAHDNQERLDKIDVYCLAPGIMEPGIKNAQLLSRTHTTHTDTAQIVHVLLEHLDQLFRALIPVLRLEQRLELEVLDVRARALVHHLDARRPHVHTSKSPTSNHAKLG